MIARIVQLTKAVHLLRKPYGMTCLHTRTVGTSQDAA